MTSLKYGYIIYLCLSEYFSVNFSDFTIMSDFNSSKTPVSESDYVLMRFLVSNNEKSSKFTLSAMNNRRYWALFKHREFRVSFILNIYSFRDFVES